MKKFKIATLVMTLLICFASVSVSAANDNYGMVTASALNVRVQPTTNSKILGKLSYGTNIDIVEKVNSWYKISYNSQTAYVHSDYVQICEKISTENISAQRAKILETAQKYIGIPYVYGGSTPKGFDCSGFVMYVYAQCGISLPRTSYAQATVGTYVSRQDLLPGDIVCFGTSSIGHVGIYVGNGKYIHSPRTGRSICIENLDNRYGNKFAYGRRVIK